MCFCFEIDGVVSFWIKISFLIFQTQIILDQLASLGAFFGEMSK